LVGNIFREWGLKCVQIKGLALKRGLERDFYMGNFGYLKTIPLTNHCPKCIGIWCEANLGQGDSSVKIKFLGL